MRGFLREVRLWSFFDGIFFRSEFSEFEKNYLAGGEINED